MQVQETYIIGCIFLFYFIYPWYEFQGRREFRWIHHVIKNCSTVFLRSFISRGKLYIAILEINYEGCDFSYMND